jgi:hypothetical protein
LLILASLLVVSASGSRHVLHSFVSKEPCASRFHRGNSETHDVKLLRQVRSSVTPATAARFEGCSRGAHFVNQTLVSHVGSHAAGTVSLASGRYEGVVDTFV